MIKDRFADLSDTPTFPAASIAEIVPDDDTDLDHVTIGVNVSAPGSLRVTTKSGDVTDVFVAAGIVFPVRVRRIWATGTTATGIRALY